MKVALILIMFFLTSQSDNVNCSDLKNGKFQTENKDGLVTAITRKENKQIENFNEGERISEFNVNWTNECEYLIYNRKVLVGNDPWPEMKKKKIKIKIIEIQDDFYKTESEMLSKGWKMNQKIQILK